MTNREGDMTQFLIHALLIYDGLVPLILIAIVLAALLMGMAIGSAQSRKSSAEAWARANRDSIIMRDLLVQENAQLRQILERASVKLKAVEGALHLFDQADSEQREASAL